MFLLFIAFMSAAVSTAVTVVSAVLVSGYEMSLVYCAQTHYQRFVSSYTHQEDKIMPVSKVHDMK
jgi:hypothetical protein